MAGNKEVIYYKRYVDDILIVFDQNKTYNRQLWTIWI